MIGMLLLRSVLIAVASMGVLWLARKRSAAQRHAIVSGALVLLIALPWLTTKLPARNLPVLPAPIIHRLETLPSSVPQSSDGPEMRSGGSLSLPAPAKLALWGWALGCALILARWIGAYASVVRRVWRAQKTSLASEVRSDPSATVALTTWAGRHWILLPPEWDRWSSGRLNHVLAHERAHIRRGDWFCQTLGRVVCAFFWPNPFAWVLARRLRDLAEEAADDLVLVSGAVPSHYAADLLEISREMRATHSAMALPMARKAEVAWRIEMILNRTKQRGGVSLTTLVLFGAILLAVGIPLASYGLGPTHGADGLLAQVLLQDTPRSYADDVANGETTPATKDNNYTGVLKDGRKVRIVQVAIKQGGKVIAWQPDGTPIPADKITKHWMTGKDREFRHILMEVESYTNPNRINAGLGSGPDLPGEPSSLLFAGGGAFAGSRPGTAYIVTLIGVPKEDGEAASFTFGMSDGSFHLESRFDPFSGETTFAHLEDAKLEAAKGPFPWDKWKQKHAKPAVHFTAKMPSGIQSDLAIVAVQKDGKEEEGDGNWGKGYAADRKLALDYYFRAPKSQIKAIEVRKREALHAEVLDLHLKPKP